MRRRGKGAGAVGGGVGTKVERERGKVTVTVVPFIGSLWTLICPPCTMMAAKAILNPNPLPRSPFVVKKVSKARRRTSSVMPIPSSLICTTAYSPLLSVMTVIVPSRRPVTWALSMMASAAFSKMLRKACRSSAGSPRKSNEGANFVSRRMVTPCINASSCQRGWARSIASRRSWWRSKGMGAGVVVAR